MGALRALREFFAPRQTLSAQIDNPFISIDLEETKRKLRLEERGREQGELNLPPADAHTLDHVEQEIVHEIGSALERAQIDGVNQIRAYDDRFASLSLLGQLSSIKAYALRASSDFTAEVLKTRDRLTTSRDAIAESYRELRDFKAEHRLARPAHEASPAIVTWGAVLFSWFLETILNTTLLRLNDAMGILGGFFAAAAIGALNVGISALIGMTAFRHLRHKQGLHRAWAAAAIALWLLILVAWNLVAAHYRDAKSAGLPEPEIAALSLFQSEPLSLDSFYSFALFGAGILFALIAAAAGYRMDDPYPGYGAVHRRHKSRCDDYSFDVAEAIDELGAIKDDAIDDAQEVRNELARQSREREQIIVARDAFRRRYDQHCAQLENTTNALLEAYRNANRRCRSELAPAHFGERWQLPDSSLPVHSVATLSEGEVAGADAALDEVIQKVTTDYETAIRSFETLETLKARLKDGEA